MTTAIATAPTAALAAYRAKPQEIARTNDILRITPCGRDTALDIGAKEGHLSRLLTGYFDSVVAVDLVLPTCDAPRVTNLVGDITALDFPDKSVDVVYCIEILEHIVELRRACSEVSRVARHEIVVGVPYKQDIRLARSTCRSCGAKNPPYGHVNAFPNEASLRALFPDWNLTTVSFVEQSNACTNALSVALHDYAGNPYGTYKQYQPCLCCGARLTPPKPMTSSQRVCAAIATRLTSMQTCLVRPHGNWVHCVFSR